MDLKKSYNNLPMPVQYLLLGGISFLAFHLFLEFGRTREFDNEFSISYNS